MKKKMSGIDDLYERAAKCHKRKNCYSTHWGRNMQIFVPRPDDKFNKKNPKVLFIMSRPGPATIQSGRICMDNEDETAKLFKKCLEKSGLKRSQIFSTNACLCLPFCSVLTNAIPTDDQIRKCAKLWLKQQIDVLKPKLIVSLGKVALEALRHIYTKSGELKKFELKNNIGTVIEKSENTPIPIYPLYHTSKNAQKSRKPPKQKKDWKKIREILDGKYKSPKIANKKISENLR
jgi:uracil-DNA glycosylase family 4